MKLLFISGRELSYVRNSVLFSAFAKNSEVINLTSYKKNYISRYLEILLKLMFTKHEHDVIFIGFYGQPLVLLIKLFSKKPVIFDAFISTYQTLCFDRQKFSPTSLPGKIAFFLDKKSCEISNMVLLDTNAHINYFVKTFGLNKDKFRRIFVGTDEKMFFPRKFKEKKSYLPKKAFFYGAYQPLHGIKYIVKATKLLEKEIIKFKIAGKGKEKEKIIRLSKKLKIKNIDFVDWIPYKKLPYELSSSDLFIGGHIGATQKAKMVIPGKTFQSIAMGIPTIIANNEANRELFKDASRPYFVTPGNHKELAEKIKTILSDNKLAKKISKEQLGVYREYASSQVITRQASEILKSI